MTREKPDSSQLTDSDLLFNYEIYPESVALDYLKAEADILPLSENEEHIDEAKWDNYYMLKKIANCDSWSDYEHVF